MAYPTDMLGMLQQWRDTINAGGASTSQYPVSEYGVLVNIRDLINSGAAATSQYPQDMRGILQNIRDLLNTGAASIAKYPDSQFGLWQSIRDFGNTVFAPVTGYPSGVFGLVQAVRDIALLGGAGAVPALLSLPSVGTSPSLVWSAVQPAGYSGSAIQVRRADTTTLDVGYRNNVIDLAAADGFSNALTVSKAYDATATGDLVNATAANQPVFTPLNTQGRTRPISIDGITAGVAKFLQASTTINRTAVTVFLVVNPRVSQAPNAYFEFSDAGFTTSYANVATNQAGLSSNNGGTVKTSTFFPRAHRDIIGYSSSASGQIFRVNGVEQTFLQATSQVTALLTLGKLVAGTSWNSLNDLFAIIVYPAALNSAQMQQVEAALAVSYPSQNSFTNRVIYGGSSLIVSWFTTLNQQVPWQGGFGRGTDWETIVMAIGGQSLATEAANVAKYTALFDATKVKNVCVIDAPSNDISLQTFADQATAEAFADTTYNNTTLPMIATLKAAGFRVVVPTIIARGSFTTVNFKEFSRLRYDSNVRSGAVAAGYTVSDRSGNSAFDTPADASNAAIYALDLTHVINAGAAIVAAIDKAAILVA